MNNIINPYIAGGVIREEVSFYGREQLVQQLSAPSNNAYFIKGNRRIGKSSLLRCVERRLFQSKESFPVFIDLSDGKTLADFGKAFCRAITDACNNPLLKLAPPSFNKDDSVFKSIAKWINFAADIGRKNCFLLLDEAEAFLDLEAKELAFLRYQMENRMKNLSIIMTATKRIEKLYDKKVNGNSLLSGFSEIKIGFLENEEAINIIKQTKMPGVIDIQDDVAAEIIRYCCCHPFLIQELCFDLWYKNRGVIKDIKKSDLVLSRRLKDCFKNDIMHLNTDYKNILLSFDGREDFCFNDIKNLPQQTLDEALAEMAALGFLKKVDEQHFISNYFLSQWLALKRVEKERRKDSAKRNPSQQDIQKSTSNMDNLKFTQGHALLIGIQYANSLQGRLPCTLADVNAIKDILTDPDKAAYPKEQVHTLLEKEATAEAILEALDMLALNAQKDSTVMIYYSGHGGSTDDRYYFVPYDGRIPVKPDGTYDWENAKVVLSDVFAQKIKAIRAKVRKVLVILDCCHAAGNSPLKSGITQDGLFLKAVSQELSSLAQETAPTAAAKGINPTALNEGEGLIVLTSCKHEETSLTGNPYSLFTTALKEALEGRTKSDSDDGWVYIEDVKSYLDQHVPQRAARVIIENKNHQQHPVTDMNGASGRFRVCAYDIAKAKGAEVGTTSAVARSSNESVDNQYFNTILILIDNDIDAAFDKMNTLNWGNKRGTYNDLKDEWINRPQGFNKTDFRSRLKQLLKSLGG